MVSLLDADVLRAELAEARDLSQQGQPAAALARLRSLRRRVERSGDTRAEVRRQGAQVLLRQAAAQFEVSGRLGPALAMLAAAEAVAADLASDALLASIRGQRGLLLLRAGRRREAMRAFDAAADVRAGADRYDVTTILLNRGVLHLDIGSLRQAAADFEECAEIASAAGDREQELRARHNLGYADFLAGRIPRALAAMDRAQALAVGPPHPIGMLDRARVLREAGLVSDAERLLGEALGLFAAGHLHQDVAETELARAECALVEGNLARARQLARSAERLFAHRGNDQWRRRAQLLGLRCERRAVDAAPAEARPVLLRRVERRAHRLAEDCRAEHRTDLARPAELLALECRLRRTARVPGPAAPPMRTTDPLPARLQTREVRALAALRRGDLARAATEVRRGLAELGSYQSGFGSLDLRTASAVHGTPLARLGLEIAQDSPAGFFAAVERARAVSSRLARVGPPTDQRTADLLGDLRRTQEEARSLEGDPRYAEELTRLRSRAARLQRDVRARAWELEGGTERAVRSSARVGEVRESARATGTAFVTLVVHRDRWRAVVASEHRPRMVDLAGAAEVDELVQRLRADLDALSMTTLPAAIADAVRRSLDAGLHRLDDLVLAPLGLDGSALVLSCTSPLVLVPWSLLPSRRGLPVVVTPSATAWLASSTAGRAPTPQVVSVAGPGLHRAEAEARRVGQTWPGATLLTGADATTEAVRDALASVDLVHVAGHGTHQQESPLFSSLRLADGPLFAYELDADGRAAQCVVLSACEAGLATVRPGDEGLGLTSVLLHLGSRSVLAGVARVADDVAERVMDKVHDAMADGTDSALALASAVAVEDRPAPFVAFGASW